MDKHGYSCTVSNQGHTCLALPVPLCFTCCSLLKCIAWSPVPLEQPQQDEVPPRSRDCCGVVGYQPCRTGDLCLGSLKNAVPFTYSSLSSWQFPLRFGQGLVSALWNSFSFEWSWRWFINQTKNQKRLIIPRLYLPVRSELSEEVPDSETPFRLSALDCERNLPSAVRSLPSAKELIVLQESRLPLLVLPLVPAVAPSVCRLHRSVIC